MSDTAFHAFDTAEGRKVDRLLAHGPILRLEATTDEGLQLDAAFPRDLQGELAGRERVRLQVKGAHVFSA